MDTRMTEISHIMNNAKISQILSLGVGYLNVIVIREMSLLCCRFCQELHQPGTAQQKNKSLNFTLDIFTYFPIQ